MQTNGQLIPLVGVWQQGMLQLGGVLRVITAVLLWLPILYLMGLLTWNTLPYFAFRADHPFFLEKAVAYRDPLWRVLLYIHITGGLMCLFAPLLQFSRTLLYRFPALHRRLGQVYVQSVFWLVVPAGFYLAWYAKGGRWGTILFSLLGVLHFYFTWAGLKTMRGSKPRMRRHAAWMIRSYLMAQTAISFRAIHMVLMVCAVENFYLHALWSSILGNLLLAECLIWITLKRRNAS